MTVKSAKTLLRSRYERRGYAVSRVRHKGEFFYVMFGQTEEGRGLGPRGLSYVRCGWPHDEPGAQKEFEFKRIRRRR